MAGTLSTAFSHTQAWWGVMQVVMAASPLVVTGVWLATGAVNEKAAVARTAMAATPSRVGSEDLSLTWVLVFSRITRIAEFRPSVERVFFAFRVLITTLRRQ